MNARDFLSDFFGRSNPKRMPSHFFFGSLRMDYKTAQKADIEKQNYTTCPRHWYVDAVFTCCGCGEEFTFSAEEQRFWYEDKKFYVDAFPKRCIQCRKAERTRIELRQRYDARISAALGDCAAEAKQEVVELINDLEIAEGELPERMRQNRATLCAQLGRNSRA
jgi:hypothetical protein